MARRFPHKAPDWRNPPPPEYPFRHLPATVGSNPEWNYYELVRPRCPNKSDSAGCSDRSVYIRDFDIYPMNPTMSEMAVVGKRYAVVIPKAIRERIHLSEGQRV